MKKTLLFIYVVICTNILGWEYLYAAEKTICDIKEKSCYDEQIKVCTSSKSPWGEWPGLWALTEKYEEFKPEKINEMIQKISQAETGDDEKKTMQKKLDTLNSNIYGGFRAGEAARLLYRRNMNQIFSCAVIASRYTKLEKLENTIGNKSGASNILESIKKEKKRYEGLMTKKTCLQNGSEQASDKVVDRLAVSATWEYCRYTYYLDYLKANVTNDFSAAVEIDAKIGGNTGSALPTTDAAVQRMTKWINTLDQERSRANTTVPKAVMAFAEMDRTYITHILLVIIYDDYIKLRDHLNTYLTIVSQTFEKAYNAQDSNNR
jgi:hypothetical protein